MTKPERNPKPEVRRRCLAVPLDSSASVLGRGCELASRRFRLPGPRAEGGGQQPHSKTLRAVPPSLRCSVSPNALTRYLNLL